MTNTIRNSQPSNLEFDSATPQALRGELSRVHALECIDSNPDARLIVIAAPSGYGKTTLVAQYARANPLNVVWCHLGEAHQDPEALESTLRNLFTFHLPEIRWVRSNSVLAEGMPVMGQTKAFAQDISAIQQRVLIVFDGCEFLSRDSEKWLNGLLDHCYAAHRFVLIGLETPNVGVSRWLARGEAVILGERDLAFSSLETEALFRSRGVNKNAYELHRQLEGWPIGLSLVASGISSNLDPTQLIQEALNRLDSDLYDCLPELAALSTWSERNVTGLGLVMPMRWLERLRAANLPLISLGNDAFRPHTLLVGVLEKALEKNPKRARELWRLGAVFAEQQREFIHAIRLYHLSGDLERALSLAEPLVTRYEWESQDDLARKILEFFAPNELHPKLKAILGVALFATGELERGETLINEVLIADPDDLHGQMFKGYILHCQGFFQEALVVYQKLELQLPEDGMKARVLRLKVPTNICLNQLDRVLENITEAVRIAYVNNNLLEVAKSLVTKANIYSQFGLWHEAEITAENALEFIQNLESPLNTAFILNDFSFFKLQSGDTYTAEFLIKKAFNISITNNLFELESVPYLTMGDIYRFKFDLKNSENQFIKSIQISNKFRIFARSIIGELNMLELAIINKNYKEYNLILINIESKINSYPYITPRLNFHKAQFAFFEGDYLLADQLFVSVETSKTRYLHIARAQVYRLECAKKLNQNIQEREAVLEETLARCGRQVLQWDAPIFDLLQDESNNPISNTPDPQPQKQTLTLELTTLGDRIVRINEEIVKISLSKSFELLVWMALHGACRRETMIDALWDGSNDPRYSDYFKVAMKRLRSALAEYCPKDFNPIKLERNQYQLNAAFELQFDLQQLKLASSSSDLQSMQVGLRQYQGSFLPGLDNTWIETERNQAQEEALNLALNIGRNHSESQHAVLAFKAALRLDPLCEEAYIKLIHALRISEQPEAATRAYRMYARMMREELGFEPDESLLSQTR
jgi:LuxR family transcriptional regulator, maltose regulon positive regulatory protein